MAETTASLEAVPETRLNPFSTLIGVMFRPHRTFTLMREAERGYWWVVAVLAVLSVIVLVAAQIPAYSKLSGGVAVSEAQSSNDSSNQPAQVQQAGGISNFLIVSRLVGNLIGLGITYLIRATILYLLGLSFGGRATFKQIFRMAVWTTLPDVIRNFVGAAAVLATGNVPSRGLSYIFSSTEYVGASKILIAILEGIDVYLIWSLVLIAVGVAATYQLSRIKSWVVTLIYWIIGLLFTIGGAAIGQVTSSLGRGG